MFIKQKLWSLLLKLPAFLKTPILRSIVAFPTEISDELRFKVAVTEDELSQAFALLHKAYVKENLMEPHQSGMRITKYHALPSTTTLIAVENKVVVATVTLIRQSAFGVPSSTIFETNNVPPGSRVAEVSALAIKKEYLQQHGRVLFPLLKFLFHYSHDYFGVSHFVIAVNPKWIDFYKSILLFKPLAKKVVANYAFVNGAPAAGAILDLTTVAEVYYKTYGKKPKNKNVHSFFHQLEPKNMEFPLRKKSVITEPMLTPQLLQHFFLDTTNCVNSMTETERFILREMYDHPDYLKLIPEGNIVSLRRKRATKRFETMLKARLLLPGNRSSQMFIQDISHHGFGGFTKRTNIDTNLRQKLLVNIEEFTPIELEGHFIRVRSNGHFGFILSKVCPRWTQFVNDLDNRMLNRTEPEKNQDSDFKKVSNG